METNAFVIRTWDDLVFMDRNRAYGAYPMRKAYSRRLILGLGVSTAVMAMLLLITNILSDSVKKITIPVIRESGLFEFIPVPPIKQDQQSKPIEKDMVPEKKSTPVRIVSESIDAPVESGTADSYPDDSALPGTGNSGEVMGTGTIEAEVRPINITGPVVVAEVMPEYVGGMEAMMKFIQKKLRYPSAPRKLGIEGTVYVSFVVNGDGSVSQVAVLRGIHPDCDEEASRVISMLPNWKGGKQGGYPVSVKMVLPIKFSLSK